MDTIFALSSGAPPAAIAVVRISGPQAGQALENLSGYLPEPRKASLVTLHGAGGRLLDRALVLWFPGLATATGEDLAELHLHGGRAVIAAVEQALGSMSGLRQAEPGEFTRRAFANGRIDLAEAEGLADLLSAETELQQQAAMVMAGGSFSHTVEDWRERVLKLSAQLEAELDFSDEDDVGTLPAAFYDEILAMQAEIEDYLASPRAEALREGYRVAFAGPPNAGKSTLFNVLLENEAAITSPIAGTTRDVLERPVALAGIPFTLVDMAGLRGEGGDEIEAIGIGRARTELERADLILWLGPEGEGPAGSLEVEARIDEEGHVAKSDPDFRLSAVTGEGISELKQALVDRARVILPKPGQVALNLRQSTRLHEARLALMSVPDKAEDMLLIAEDLRQARLAFDRLIGRTSTEDMLDALFGRFCIGK
jgi:tRNA modification GTPase